MSSKIYLPNEETNIDKKSEFLKKISKINTIIPNAILILSLVSVPFGSAIVYLYHWGCATYYRLPAEYFTGSAQISEWLANTLIIFMSSFLFVLFTFICTEKAIIKEKYHPAKLCVYGLLGIACIGVLTFFLCPFFLHFVIYFSMLYCMYIYLFVCYGHLFCTDTIKLQKRKRYCNKINALKNKTHFKNISNFLISRYKKKVERKDETVQVRSQKLLVLKLILGILSWIALVCAAFFGIGYVNASVNKNFRIIIDKTATQFETENKYDMIVSETSEYYYILKCTVKSSSSKKSYIITIYNDVVSLLKKTDDISIVEYSFDSVELKKSFLQETSTD